MIGMKIATYANVRVSNKARETEDIGETVKVAFRGGSVMGLCVGGFALLGLFLVYMIFGLGMHQAVETEASYVNLIGLKFVPFTMTLSGYALGCSMVAMFNRVGGGIYTKAADMGADLVGKTEAHIPEDDPRNPATIADNVGDNVGDVAGLGSDLLESYVGALQPVIREMVLLIGIDSDKIHTGDAACDHSVNNIISGAADANNLNIYNFFFKRFGHMLSSYVLIFYLSHAKPNCRRIIYKRG